MQSQNAQLRDVFADSSFVLDRVLLRVGNVGHVTRRIAVLPSDRLERAFARWRQVVTSRRVDTQQGDGLVEAGRDGARSRR